MCVRELQNRNRTTLYRLEHYKDERVVRFFIRRATPADLMHVASVRLCAWVCCACVCAGICVCGFLLVCVFCVRVCVSLFVCACVSLVYLRV